MDGLLFLIMLVCLGMVATWYVVNERRDTEGDEGILALKPDKTDDDDAPAYRKGARVRDRKPETIEKERVRQAAQPSRQRVGVRAGAFRERREGAYQASLKGPRRASPFGEVDARHDTIRNDTLDTDD